MPKNPTKKQVRYLLSSVSPLSTKQKDKFKKELHSGKAKVRRSVKTK
jgi:hypothetical protein